MITNKPENIKREATDGEVLSRWLQGAGTKVLAPFFMFLNAHGTNLKACGKLPSGSFYPIVTTSVVKCTFSHQFYNKFIGSYLFINQHLLY